MYSVKCTELRGYSAPFKVWKTCQSYTT